jgi:hypothetical protein
MPVSIFNWLKEETNAAIGEAPEIWQDISIPKWLDFKSLQVTLRELLQSAEKGEADAVRDRDAEFLSMAEFFEAIFVEDSPEMTLEITAKDAMSILRELEGTGTFDIQELKGCGSKGAGRIAQKMLDIFICHILKSLETEALDFEPEPWK